MGRARLKRCFRFYLGRIRFRRIKRRTVYRTPQTVKHHLTLRLSRIRLSTSLGYANPAKREIKVGFARRNRIRPIFDQSKPGSLWLLSSIFWRSLRRRSLHFRRSRITALTAELRSSVWLGRIRRNRIVGSFNFVEYTELR